jgi:hypothetical protein
MNETEETHRMSKRDDRPRACILNEMGTCLRMRLRTQALSFLFCLMACFGHTLVAQSDPLFYKGYPYGSQAHYNPFTIIMNGSFDILQVSNRNNDISSIQFANGFRNVWWNLTHAGSVVSEYGWEKFLKTDVFPTSIQLKNAQYWPNYKLHLIGGGITYVATAEWYEQHDFPSPKIFSALTMGVYHVLNEAVENGGYTGPSVDPIADLLIFDPLGIALFSIPGVPEFFSQTLHAADWSFQPVVNIRRGTLLNNGQTFSFKFNFPWSDQWRIFYLTGMEGGLGITKQLNRTDDLSVSGGLATRELVEVEEGSGVRTLTAKLVWTAGIFYDRNGSLLSSLILGGGRGYIVRLNVYPGVVTIFGLRVGGVFLLEQNGTPALGVTIAGFPAGLGI